MNLDDQKIYKRLDVGNVAESLESLPLQIKQVLGDSIMIKVPQEYSRVNNIVVNGMGGSNLGARIVRSALSDQIKAPIEITPCYRIPNYVGPDTLFIISSYSGTTEESLSIYNEVKKRGAKIMGITSKGKGKLEKIMIKDNVPGYIFQPNNNPSGQPRLGLGYSIFGTMVLLAKAGLFEIKTSDIEAVISKLGIRSRELRPQEPAKLNTAKTLAGWIHGRIPVFVGSEFTVGVLHTMRNQVNETSKNFADYLILPDLNHYAMEGLGFPKSNTGNLIFVFFDSKLYHPRTQLRSRLTKEVVKKNRIRVVEYELSWKSRLEQAFELLQLGTWLSYYLGIMNGIDPVKVPWVDWFKKELN
jgi:glucose/mannose-6-phosphate isomerase